MRGHFFVAERVQDLIVVVADLAADKTRTANAATGRQTTVRRDEALLFQRFNQTTLIINLRAMPGRQDLQLVFHLQPQR